MSTKITISHSSRHHLYEEIFDKSNVYLKIEGHEFEISNDKVMIQIPIETWRAMLEDWEKRGWPKEEDHEEFEISENWLNSLESTVLSINKDKKDE